MSNSFALELVAFDYMIRPRLPVQSTDMKTLLLCLSVGSVSLWAQSNFATLSGSVEDPQRQPVAHANVSLKAAETGAVRSVAVNVEAIYEFAGLAPGEYELEVTADGFARQTRHLRVEVGQRMRLDLALALGEAKQDVEVVGFAETLKTADASVGEVVEQQSIRELPLNGRSLLDLALTVPGSHHSHGAQNGDMHPLYWRPGQDSALSIGGSRPNANYFLLDGVVNTDPTFNAQNLSISPDAVLEFKVQTGSYSAEMGGAGGGQINIVTKSGTSQFHGAAIEFLRNNKMDAHNFNEMAEGASHLRQNNLGASLGGPIKGRTFFFTNFEGLRKRENHTMVETVPTAEESLGDFSNSGANIFNPFSSINNPNFDPSKPNSPTNPQIIRAPFPNNVIPNNLISPVASRMLAKWTPRPNSAGDAGMGMSMMGVPLTAGGGASLDANNLTDTRLNQINNTQGTVRIDRYFGAGDTLYGRYSVSSENGFTAENLPGYGSYNDNMAQHATVAWNHIISSTKVNTASFAMSRLVMHRLQENAFQNDIVTDLGIQGVGCCGADAFGSPYFSIQGYSPLGDSYIATPMYPRDTVLEWRDSFSWQHGRHALKFGGSFKKYMWPMWGYFQNRGYFQFTNGPTTQTATADGTGSGLATFMLGLPGVRQRQAPFTPSMDLRQWYMDAFVQDSWRIGANTTLEIGLRYEYMDPLYDVDPVAHPLTNLLNENGKLTAFIGGQNGTPDGLLYPNKLRFAPRFGISHHIPSAGFVVRGSYGIFYTPVDMNNWCNQVHDVPRIFPETNQSDNYIPSITNFNFAPAVLGTTVVSFTAFDPHAAPQYIQQWSFSIEKALDKSTTLEIGYQRARGLHLARAHLINNAPPGPGLIQPRRPFQTATFAEGTKFPDYVNMVSTTFRISAINVLENTARSWYDGGYVNLRRRYSHGLSLLANYTWAKNLADAPEFRSPMFESAIPQDNNNLFGEKGPGCDIRHRFSLSGVYELPGVKMSKWSYAATRNWRISSIFQAQTGFPFTISVFGDTANAGAIIGENPVRANYNGGMLYGPGTKTADMWFMVDAFSAPSAYTFGNVGRNTVYGPGMVTLDSALERDFSVTEAVKFRLRGEFFNSLNRTNLGTPNRFVNTPQFGMITEATTPNRQLQVSMRLFF